MYCKSKFFKVVYYVLVSNNVSVNSSVLGVFFVYRLFSFHKSVKQK